MGSAIIKNDTVTQYFIDWLSRPVLLFSLVLSIPVFYLLLGGESDSARLCRHALYGFVSLLLTIDATFQWKVQRLGTRSSGKLLLDIAIIVGCVFSAFPSAVHWGWA